MCDRNNPLYRSIDSIKQDDACINQGDCSELNHNYRYQLEGTQETTNQGRQVGRDIDVSPPLKQPKAFNINDIAKFNSPANQAPS